MNYLITWVSKEQHDEAHRLVYLPKEDPEAPPNAIRQQLKELLFPCHYANNGCTYLDDVNRAKGPHE